jgi:histidinol-phosphate phosphatase family protein
MLYDIVVPTVGRASLRVLLGTLDAQPSTRRGAVIVVDDREARRGPAAARNAGIAAATAPWIVFLDDDVVPTRTWARDLERDLDAAPGDVAGVQGRIAVPLPAHRRPTDWERNVAGLETATWATADMAYRRDALLAVGGFDERFRRAYREDADLGLRVVATGARIVPGRRLVQHPVRPAPWHVSVGKQAGNADDALMDRRHGRGWRARAGAPRGARKRHVATTVAGAVALGAAAARRSTLATVASASWAVATADFAWRRIRPGPRTTAEIAAMVATSAAIPPVAAVAYARGAVRARRIARAARPQIGVDAVLFDRDGTLVVDVPYNRDPDRVRAVPGAREAVARVRAAGVPVAVVSNQSGVARGWLRDADVRAVNARVDELVGPFDAFCVCPHGPGDGCECRKPAPGLVHEAAKRLGVAPGRCAVIGDIGADVEAARRAGALGVLVPTPVTRDEEVAAAPVVVADLAAAVDFVLRPRQVTR